MPTGGGKSMCYQLPALMLDGVALVISPLIALMKNQVDAIRGHHEDKRVAHFLNSSLGRAEAERVKMDVAEGWTKMLYVAPESLTKAETIEFLKSVRVSFVAVDEAHSISEWGHDFRPEYRRIKPIVKKALPTCPSWRSLPRPPLRCSRTFKRTSAWWTRLCSNRPSTGTTSFMRFGPRRMR